MVEQRSSTIHKFTDNPSLAKSYYRFLKNPSVAEVEICNQMYKDCASRSENRNVVVLADTSSITLQNKKNRIKDSTGLSRVWNNTKHNVKGLLLHTNMAFDQYTHEPLGISNTRFIERKPKSRDELGERQKRCIEPIEEKESYRWIRGFEESKNQLKDAARITLVADREADIIELIDRLPDERTDLVIRSQHNRNVIDEEGRKRKLTEVLSSSLVQGKTSLIIRGNNRKERKAKLEIRAATVMLTWHHSKNVLVKKHERVPINVIEVREKIHRGFKNEPALVWRILTTKSVGTLEQIKEVIDIYRLRWKIEEYFKLLKSDCFDIENTEITRGTSIRKLILFIMKASIKIQQLKAARDGKSGVSLGTVFNDEEIKYLHLLNPELEGKTEKQQNPYARDKLAYGSWIIARLGGWKEFYDKSRPPGTKTFAAGIERFENIIIGIKIGKDVS